MRIGVLLKAVEVCAQTGLAASLKMRSAAEPQSDVEKNGMEGASSRDCPERSPNMSRRNKLNAFAPWVMNDIMGPQGDPRIWQNQEGSSRLHRSISKPSFSSLIRS